MATVQDRRQDNAPGKYYIDDTCDYCEVCLDEAPNNIKKSDCGEYSIIFKQPENSAELRDIRNAIVICPNEAIGDDGDDE